MSDVPMELIVAAFPDEDGASKALTELKEARKEKLIDITDAAVIQRAADNKLHIRETGDMSGGRGAVIGGIVGAAIGLVAPPAVLVTAGVGAAIGGLAARLRDSGFPDDRLRELGEALQPGTSALVAVIEHTWVAEVERELAELGARMVTEEIKAEIASQLEDAKVEAAPASAASGVGQATATATDTATDTSAMASRQDEAATSAPAVSMPPVATPVEARVPEQPTEQQPPQSSPS
ncbi:MAG TPA: DUF1269 domain-containing protein [Ktedonobacterales bacterium]